MGEGSIVLLLILCAGMLGGNQLVSVSAAVMLLLQAGGLADVLRFLEARGIEIGIIFLMLGLLLPFATDKLGLSQTLRNLIAPAGIISIGVGAAAAYLAAQGVVVMRAHPEVLVGLIVGSVLGVSFLQGIPAGPLVAAGLAAMIYRVIGRWP
ncbi:MAG: DUF441 domain-containing protein [Firmicutes bacterium]|nr:DUF441 domain-containing protein [Bacillota bacterium]